MAQLAYPVRPAAARTVTRDFRSPMDTSGTINQNNRVYVQSPASSPKVPFAGARVRLHRLSDGWCAWQGISDADGWYWPTGLEVGLAYYPIGIDLTGQFQVVAAGPVVAVAASADLLARMS